ncbi:MAG: Ig-like domain-containing protein, partial [Endozoicomonas sp. (ex Botrylloides leachii)]|nr:Ig-like domain-containing protein [Endozoicomonas sp. (ex Botrylloides leachii)]
MPVNSSNNPAIGLLKSSSKSIEVINSKGEIRVVSVGDIIYLDDEILNYTETDIIIRLIDGQLLIVAPSEKKIIGKNLLDQDVDDSLVEEDDDSNSSTDIDNASLLNNDSEIDEESSSSDSINAEKPEEIIQSSKTDKIELIIERDKKNSEGEEYQSVETDSEESERISSVNLRSLDLVTPSLTTATTAINVTDTNDRPVVSQGVFSEANENASNYTVNLLEHAIDVDDDSSLAVSDGSISWVSGDARGIRIDDSQLTVQPVIYNNLALGEQETIVYQYSIEDGEGGTVDQTASITVTGRNDSPTVSSIIERSVSEDSNQIQIDLLAGASDIDNSDILSVQENSLTLVSGNDAGVVIIDSTLTIDLQSYQYLKSEETNRIEYSYTIEDSNGGFVPQTAILTITGSNDGPQLISSIVEEVQESDSEFTINLLSGITDIDDAETLQVINVSLISGDDRGAQIVGSQLTVNPQSYRSLTEGESESLVYEFDVEDSSGETVRQTATITVVGGNNAPEISGEITATTTDQQSIFSINLLENASDSDVDDTLAVQEGSLILSSGDDAGISLNGNTLFVDPSAYKRLAVGDQEVIRYSYQVVDSRGAASAHSVAITVSGSNDQPVVERVDVEGNEEDSITGSFVVSEQDSGDVHAFTILSQPDRGSVTNNNDGTFTFIPGPAFQGLNEGEIDQVTFSYIAVDSSGENNNTSDPEVVTISIIGTNNQPVAEIVSIEAIEEGSLVTGYFSATDNDEGNTHTFEIVTQPESGTVINNNDGSFSFSPSNGFQHLSEGESGEVTFSYRAIDNSGASNAISAVQVVTVKVTGTNDQPEVEEFSINATDGSNIVTASFEVTDADSADNHTFTILSQPTTGVVTNNGDGTFSFDPQNGFGHLSANETASVTFTYIANDNSGTGNAESEVNTVTVIISGTNNQPVVQDLSFNGTADGSLIEGDFVVSDGDTTDTHTFTIVSGPDKGTVTNNNDGSFSFNPNNDFKHLGEGEVEQIAFSYQAVDDSGEANNTSELKTVTMTITGTNNQPVAEVVSIEAMERGVSVTGNFSVIDSDITDNHTFSITSQLAEGSVINNNDGTFTFFPGNNFQDLSQGEIRTITFEYVAIDNSGTDTATSEPQTVTVNITGTNNKPVVEVVSINSDDASIALGSFVVNDTDSNDSHTFSIVSPPALGTVTNNNDGTFSFNPNDDFRDLKEGEISQVTFTYIADDGSGTANARSDETTVTIRVIGGNDRPIAEIVSIEASEGGNVITGQFSVTDGDEGDSHSFNIISQPSEGTVTNNNDGTFSFSPGNAFQNLAEGEVREVTFEYVAVDDSGTATNTSEVQIVTIAVAGTNDTPQAEVVNIAALDGGVAVTGSFVVTDVDSNDTHTFTITSPPDAGVVVNNGDGTFSFNVSSDFKDLTVGETRQVSFSYTATDSSGTGSAVSNESTVVITVTGSNDRPVAEVVAIQAMEEGGDVTGRFLASDADNSDSHTFMIVSQPESGVVTNNNDGTFRFNPNNDFQYLSEGETKEVTFGYVAIDNSGEDNATSEPVLITVTVTGTNDKPRAEIVEIGTSESDVVTGRFEVTDSDSGDSHTFIIQSEPNVGTLTNNNDGTFSFDPDGDFRHLSEGEVDQVSFTYVVVDNSGAENNTSDPQTVTMTITGTNDRPVAEIVEGATTKDNTLVGEFRVLDGDDSDSHTFNIITQPNKGTVINNNDGTFSFEPGDGFNHLQSREQEEVTFTYEAVDNSGASNATSAPQTITIIVTGTNYQPEAEVVSVDINEDDNSVQGYFGVTDGDDIDSHTFEIRSQPEEGSVVNNGDGSFTFTPNRTFQNLKSGETREVTFTYVAIDDSGAANAISEVQTGTIVVHGADEQAETVYLSDMTATDVTGVTELGSDGLQFKNDVQSYGGRLSVEGVYYEKGVYQFPSNNNVSQAIYDIPEGATSFSATLGLMSNGTARFSVLLDGIVAYQSGTVSLSNDNIPINVPINGESEITLQVDALGSNSGDQAVWADAKLEVVPETNEAPSDIKLVADATDEFSLHQNTSGAQVDPVVTALDTGGFMTVWTQQTSDSLSGGDGNGYSVKARIFDEQGNPSGDEFFITTGTLSDQNQASVTTLDNGDVLVSWRSSHSGKGQVYGRRFNAEGVPQTVEMTLADEVGTGAGEPDITALANGGYLSVWTDWSLDGSSHGIYAQRFTDDGEGLGQFKVNTHTSGSQLEAEAVGLNDGGYVIVWYGKGEGQTSADGVYLRHYNAQGLTINETVVSDTIEDYQLQTQVTALVDGGYVVTWVSNHNGSYNTYGKVYNKNGEAIGDELLLVESDKDQTNDAVVAIDDGGFLIGWSEDYDTFAQRFNAEGEAVNEAFRLNDQKWDKQDSVQLDVLKDGRVVAVWESDLQDGSSRGVYGKVITLDGLAKDNITNGASVGKVFVNDLDIGENHEFELDDDAAGRFAIDKATGVITVIDAENIDYTENPSHDISVTVTDNFGHTITKILTIEIAPANHVPQNLSLGMVDSGELTFNQYQSSPYEPVITALDGGGFITTWVYEVASEDQGGDGDDHSIKARRFNADGEPEGDEFIVNQSTYNHQVNPSVTELANGDVLMTWSSFHSGSNYRVYGRRFDQDGNALGDEFALFESAGNYQLDANISALEGGGYIVSWYDDYADGNNSGVFAQRFNAEDEGFGQFQVNSYTTGAQDSPDTAGLSDGGYVIVWDGRGENDTGTDSIYLRHYSSNGKTLQEVQVNNTAAGTQSEAQVTALAEGGFIVTWQSNHNGTYTIYGRHYGDDGKPLGVEFEVSQGTDVNEYKSSVLALNDGGFMVSWHATNQDGAGDDVYARRYDINGQPVNNVFKLNDFIHGDQKDAQLTQLDDGRIAFTWQTKDGAVRDTWSIKGKVLALEGQANESAGIGTPVGQVTVDDADFGDTHQFELLDDGDGRFAIDEDTGVITIADPNKIDFSEAEQHDLSVQVTDEAGHSLTQTLTINVTQSNRAPDSISLEPLETDAFQLHEFSTSDQIHPNISSLNDGGFIAVWSHSNASTSQGGDGDNYSVKARLFDEEGQPRGNEFLVNEFTAGAQYFPSVTTLANGDTLITWMSGHEDGSNGRIYGRRFDAEGNALGGDFQLYETAGVLQLTPEIAALDDGGYLVSWRDASADNGGYGIFSQRFSENDEGFGQFQVNGYSPGTQTDPDNAGLTNGGYVIVWEGSGSDQTSDSGVYLRQFNAQGHVVQEITVSNTLQEDQQDPSVSALADGGYVVSWSSQHEGNHGVYARVFNASGEPQGDEFKVSQNDDGFALAEDVIGLDDGGFIATWRTSDVEGASSEVFARRFDASGNPINEAYKINDYIGDDQDTVRLDLLSNGSIAAVWQSDNEDGSEKGVFGKVMSLGDSVKDNASSGTAVGRVAVDDPDFGDEHQFALIDDAGGRFAIDSNTGVITVVSSDYIDYSDATEHEVEVRVTDSAGHTLNQTLIVNVMPSNHAPMTMSLSRAETEEFSVNQETTDDQREPVVTALANGGFMSVWTNHNSSVATGGDGSSESVKARLFDASGQPTGDEFQINNSTTNVQGQPAVVTLVNGDTLVVWQSNHSGTYRTYGRRFDEEGNALTDEFTVYQTMGSGHSQPEITTLADGGYLVTWRDWSQDGSGSGIYAQRFDKNNQGTGQFKVNSYTTNDQYTPDAIGLSDGGYVVAWNGRGDGQEKGAFLRHYGPSGNTITETVISSNISGTQDRVQLAALDEGGYIASWSSNHNGTYQVYAKRFDEIGQPLGDDFLVTDSSDFNSWNQDILALNDGGYIISWSTTDADGALGEVHAQQYDADGNAQGEPFMVNDYIGNNQYHIELSQLQDGRIVSVWGSDGSDEDGYGISGKLFSLVGTVKDSAVEGTEVGKINIDDPDLLDTHRFELIDDADGRFSIDENTGVIRVADPELINYNDAVSHELSVRVTDSVGYELTETFTLDVSKSSEAPTSMSLTMDEGEPFVLHAFEAGDQYSPVITSLDNGNLLAVWRNANTSSATGGDGSSGSINARILDAQGRPQSPEFRVNETITNNQDYPSVTTLTNGDVLMTWASSHSGAYRIYARRYDDSGNPLSGEFTIAESSGANQYEPSISSLSDGGYLVSWQDSSLDGSSSGVFAQQFNGDDEGLGQFRVNTYTANDQYGPDTDNLPDGGYIVAWTGRGADQSGNNGVYFRQYSADGSTVVETTASNTLVGEQTNAQVTVLSDGSYVISWSSNHDGNNDVYARRFSMHGEPLGDEFRVTPESASNEYNRDIVALSDGGFMVSWDNGSNGDGVYAQRFNEYGEARGQTFQINDYMGGGQTAVQLQLMSDGRVAAAWQSAGQDSSGTGVYGRYIALDGVIKDTVLEGASVGRIQVNDPDQGDTHTFTLTDDANGRFVINAETGVITVADPDQINYQDAPSHNVTVSVTDSTGNVLTQTFTIDVAASHYAPVGIRLEAVESEEFDINAFAEGLQSQPELTALKGGGFISVWTNANPTVSTGGDGSSNSIKARLFDDNGEPVGAEFLVNTQTNNLQQYPAATTLNNGDVMVTWASYHDDSTYRVYGRRYDEDGNALTGEIQLFETGSGSQTELVVAALADGGYIATWHDSAQDGSGQGIFAQRFTADNEGLGQYRVNSYTSGNQRDPSVTGLNNGSYVITWEGPGSEDTRGVYFRLHNANGETLVETLVNTTTSGTQYYPQVTDLVDGGYVITWSSDHQGVNNLYARRFNNKGEPQGDEFLVNALPGDEYSSDVISLNDGGFLVSWHGDLAGSGHDSYAKRFNADGEVVGSSFRLNDSSSGHQSTPQLQELADGRIVAAWQSEGSDGSSYGIVGKILTLDSVVKEGSAAGTAVGQIKVDDPDQNDQHSYELIDDAGGRFAIDANTGLITVVDPSLIDHSDAAQHEVTVKVTDSTGNELTETITLDVTIGNRAPESLSLGRVESDAFALHTYTASDQHTPVISPLDNGGFISVWRTNNSSSSTGGDGSHNSIKAQRFDTDGEKVGSEFLVNTNTSNEQTQPSVTTLTDGDVLITWSSTHSGSYRIYGRRFDQDGNAQTSDMVLFESSGTHQYDPDISALEDGGFIVSWEDASLDSSRHGIYSQRFSAENVGYGQVKVNSYTAENQYNSSTAGLADGGYVIAWQGEGADQTGDNGIYLRRYDANGETVAEVTVNETLSGDQNRAQVTALADGGYVVSWDSPQDGSSNIYARTYNAAGEAT